LKGAFDGHRHQRYARDHAARLKCPRSLRRPAKAVNVFASSAVDNRLASHDSATP
jgi:hypothetical protein